MIEVKNDGEVVKTLSAKVDDSWIKKKTVPGRPVLDYIPIDKTIFVLNKNFGDRWDCTIKETSWTTLAGLPMVNVIVTLKVCGVSRDGVGSDVAIKSKKTGEIIFDPDKMSKTAYANAIKKASNLFGFGLELWDESNLDLDGTHEKEVLKVDQEKLAAIQKAEAIIGGLKIKRYKEFMAGIENKTVEQINNVVKFALDKERLECDQILENLGWNEKTFTDFIKAAIPSYNGNWLTLNAANKNATLVRLQENEQGF